MLLLLLLILWFFGGIYCMVVDWTEKFDVQGRDVPVLVVAGVLIGPIVGLFHCLAKLGELLTGKWWLKVIVRSKV